MKLGRCLGRCAHLGGVGKNGLKGSAEQFDIHRFQGSFISKCPDYVIFQEYRNIKSFFLYNYEWLLDN